MKRILWLTALLTFLIDQAVKYLVVHILELKHPPYEHLLFDPFLNLRMAWNYGINFGLLAHESGATRWVLIGVAIVIILFVLFWIGKERPGRRGYVAAGLLVGGALGNVVDRLVYGAVADFINMSCCGLGNPYSFNLADVAIFAGAFGLIIWTGQKPQAVKNGS